MLERRLVSGGPNEPDTGDWNALCGESPGPHALVPALFGELAGGLPERAPTETSESDSHRVHTIWFGDDKFGVKVTEIESPETTAFPMSCTWETFGLPGIKLTWTFNLEYAGQLGYCAFRHQALVCRFDAPADEQRLSAIWQRVIGKTPSFDDAV